MQTAERRSCHLRGCQRIRTNIYIDGFNLYYGAVKYTPYKWLDIAALSRRLLAPEHEIAKIRYFTAKIAADPRDPNKPNRQDLYIRALQTIPNLAIHYGHYLEHPTMMPLANPPGGKRQLVEVLKTEEKGSDVNLASFLVLDAHNDAFEQAIVVSNDSDLATPMKMLKRDFGLPVGVWNPHTQATCDRYHATHPGSSPKTAHPSVTLKKASNFRSVVTSLDAESDVAKCQFPGELTDAIGTFRKPAAW